LEASFCIRHLQWLEGEYVDFDYARRTGVDVDVDVGVLMLLLMVEQEGFASALRQSSSQP
jgi:hypothetical protein